MSYDFRGKVALVTGVSRGIGKEVTKRLVKSGAKVYALAKLQENLDVLKTEIPDVETVCVDISKWNETRRMVDDIGDIDLLVNNAAIATPTAFGEITEEIFDSIFSVNLKPAINISQVVVEKLKNRGKPGSIVNISSVASLNHFPNVVVYSMSKAALDNLTKTMAVKLAPFKIRVNSVNPTAVYTDLIKPFLEREDLVNAFKRDIPLNDFCYVEDIAESVLFLLSKKARMITGLVLAVDGGQCSN